MELRIQVTNFLETAAKPLSVSEIAIGLSLKETQVSQALWSLTQDKMITKVYRGRYAALEVKPRVEDESIYGAVGNEVMSVLRVMEDPLTIRQIRENTESNLTYQQVYSAADHLKRTGKIIKPGTGIFQISPDMKVSIGKSKKKVITASEALKVSTEIITASEAIRRTHFVSLKNGNKEKAEKLGGDYMLAVLIGPGIVKEKGWGVDELFELGWSDIKKQLTLFKSPDGRPLIKGSDSYCLAFPLPTGMGFPIVPGSDPIPVFKKDIGGTATTISMNVSKMSLHY